MLFGPVSITSEYQSMSRSLIAAYLREHNSRTDLARLVKPKHPLRRNVLEDRDLKAILSKLRDVQELSELVSEIEEDRKGIPILIKQYLKLGGTFLHFSVDHQFSDVLDALILVDLTQTDRKILERYLDKEGAASFLSYHRSRGLAHCA
jgi:hypothetical protein